MKSSYYLTLYTSYVLLVHIGIYLSYCLYLLSKYFTRQNTVSITYNLNSDHANFIDLGKELNILSGNEWKNNIYSCNVYYKDPVHLNRFSYTYLVNTYNCHSFSDIKMTLLNKEVYSDFAYRYHKLIDTLFYNTNRKNNTIFLVVSPGIVYSKLNMKYGVSNMEYTIDFNLKKLK